MPQHDYKYYYQRNLPHYQPKGATLFVTFRLAGSLPREFLNELAEQSKSENEDIDHIKDLRMRNEAMYKFQKKQFAKWDAQLDANVHGPSWLIKPDIANIVSEAIRYRDGKVYNLIAYCIMPNHVHMVCTPMFLQEEVLSLARVMQSLKGYTAWKANKVLGLKDNFWQHESYDHVVRDDAELERIVNYVINNPVKAGLCETWDAWPWTYCIYEI
jgi:putative transposase